MFIHDRLTGQTTRVSVASNGTEGNNFSWSPSLSADGRYVAFESRASNLVPDDTNNLLDVFVHDRVTGQTTRVSVASNGTQGNGWSRTPSLSADGRYVAFGSDASNLVPNDTNGRSAVFVHQYRSTRLGGDVDDSGCVDDADLLAVLFAFGSSATNLPGDLDENGIVDIADLLIVLFNIGSGC